MRAAEHHYSGGEGAAFRTRASYIIIIYHNVVLTVK